jgi:hypothetical protein
MKIILLSLPLLITGLCFAESSPVNSKNWMTHPEIKRIRSLYNEIEETAKKGGLKKTTLPKECGVSEEEGASIQATLYETQAGLVQKYELSGGSGDSAADTGYYYDKAEKLRFVFQSLRAVNGTEMETRTYFDRKGTVLYQDERLKKGPGWAGGFPETIPDPREHFTSLCK